MVPGTYIDSKESFSLQWSIKRCDVSIAEPPFVWLRYVNDIVLIHKYNVDGFTNHINNIDDDITSTTEPEQRNRLPFLYFNMHIQNAASMERTIFRKPTHTDKYINFLSHYPIVHKRSVMRTLKVRANQYFITIWVRWRLKSPASPLFTQTFIQAQIKENIKAPRHWPLSI